MDENKLLERLIRGEISDSTYKNGGKPLIHEIGARVKSLTRVGNRDLPSQEGTIVYMQNNTATVEFDENIGGHNGSCRINGEHRTFKQDHCWNINTKYLQLL